MNYVYVLKSKKDGLFYTGFTDDLKRQVTEHNLGLQESTKNRVPLELIYYEGCLNKKDAIRRETYLKSGVGKKYIKIRLKTFLED